ncbi:ciliary neurotrophic factor receptor subunit alpha isoform X3 [Corvus cornix cornix]|uniref:ciliary neurotrophic factor receptor subunit alpha isoform X2 n=2 Tax=Corvus TaxID=30420 RepID=UPI00081649A3|nr:PREDICTED: ciliary neurotrophic factor receptor subunit alpha isoform X2 [Corvus brachyrhynchos]XP_017602134.1 PREDICTED: ciliary neurotrophic factor receptor subunit alpha isoform X2 [Corvus brachyrhynchos]XP_017602135.1 PREDICTED: ciliary neurotrophic factor receptor subunit alpha isoform X2 [Corvus brachyrhynchos]XP_019139021.1 ciliary neurotrophic factor receptor subunit alpha isoform X3 [Corvus cornix cornix]XP_039423293.1 ciliary neurotrophic factor receptor subunit alpha isoform X3 [C
MANPVPSACCVVLAVVVVVYAQRHSQQDSHTQYERVGADVTMKCGSMDWDAAVTWTANGTDIDESHLNGSYLILKNVDLSQSGQYSCYEGSSWHLKYQTYLKVGNQGREVCFIIFWRLKNDQVSGAVLLCWKKALPHAVQDGANSREPVITLGACPATLAKAPPKEPVLMCRSNNYPKGFYCSWHLPTPTYIPNTFNISVIHGTKDMVCEKDAVPKNRCHIRYLQLFSTVKYKVTLTVTNALGKNFTTLTFDEFAIVKPDPPESVVAKPVPNNPRRLEVSWQNPSSWPDPESFPLKFFLRYRPLILDQWQHVELSDGTSHTITDAYAGKEYIIQVAAKDNDIGTWSDWSVAVHATPWTEEPKHLTTEAQITETTSASTSSFMAPPTTKICDKGAVVGSGAVAVCWTAGLVVAAYSVLFI